MLNRKLILYSDYKSGLIGKCVKITCLFFASLALVFSVAIDPVRSADIISTTVIEDSDVIEVDVVQEPAEQVLNVVPDIQKQDEVKAPSKQLYEYRVKSGDNLSTIFERFGIPYDILQSVLEADADYLSLETLQVGDLLRFWWDEETAQLNKFQIEFNLLTKVNFSLQHDSTFVHKAITKEGKPKLSVVVGEIAQSFSVSAQHAGMAFSEIRIITELFENRINFSRDLWVGDQFDVVRTEQYIDGKPTGLREIQAVRLERRGRLYTAYRHKDGNYYDQDGNSLSRSFQRFPTSAQSRVTSHFNKRRKHPVTGRISPHTGTDFSAKVGTPVVSTADGVVVMVRNHPFAGRYLVIDHGNNYKTRYMHNSKILVKEGQEVYRGEEIALSGRTGRVTGPHIHYELLLRGQAIDPMRANIPLSKDVSLNERKDFKLHVEKMNELMQAARSNH